MRYHSRMPLDMQDRIKKMKRLNNSSVFDAIINKIKGARNGKKYLHVH